MPEDKGKERYEMIFDSGFIQISREIAEKRFEKVVPIGHGAAVIINHEMTGIVAQRDNGMLVRHSATARLPDAYHPVIDIEEKKVVGVFFTESGLWRLYKGVVVKKGTKLEFGRFLVFVPCIRIVHKLMLEKYGLPLAALLIPN